MQMKLVIEMDGKNYPVTVDATGGGTIDQTQPHTKSRFGKSDQVFHQVAGGQVKRPDTKVPVASTAEKTIPLDDEAGDGFQEFNS